LSLKGKLRKNEHLARHTSFKVGGPVQFWAEPRDRLDLGKLVNLAHKKKLPLLIIGAGSNILVDDKGIKGIVAKLNSPYFKRILVNQQVISAGAGLSLSSLVRCAKEKSLSGFERLAGIPGTAGGALIMNAGNIGDRVLDVTVMNKQGRVKTLRRENIHFGYRNSDLGCYIILSARFKLIKKNKRTIAKSINKYLDYRRRTQDLSWPSAGCIFKNPDSKSVLRLRSLRFAQDFRRTLRRSRSAGLMVGPLISSGRLKKCRARSRRKVEPSAAYFIERAGLKGSSIGDAVVSLKHANFIINKGRASSADILRLMSYITKSVKRRFNLDLEPEIKIWR